ncbi:MAG: DUF1772 domain-containing protein [Anaerolineae bacterium]|jgi:uncharacterized membrane protein|nr:DUF1772 domain-containing protein [Anaerolineae bacterium]
MITFTAIALIIGTLCVGWFSGLMFSLVFLLQPKWDRQSASDYLRDLQPFLAVGKGNHAVSAILFIGLLAPLPTVFTWPAPSASLSLIAVVIFGIAALGITIWGNLPLYTAFMALDPDHPDPSWSALRLRFYRLNLARWIGSSIALICLLLALLQTGGGV